jgi:TRAP-type mannitol/chloroaromatic compound transport system permease small subunit
MMKKMLKAIGKISEYSGKVTSWLCVVLVFALCFETFMRYVFNAPTSWVHLTSMMILGTIILIGLAYTELYDSHVRIDVLYRFYPPRAKAILDILGAAILLFPLLFLLLKVSVGWAILAWVEHEIWNISIWRPPAGPFRTIVVIGIFLYALQSLAVFARNILILIGRKSND